MRTKSTQDVLVGRLATAIDDRDWPLLADLATADIRYGRHGYPTITGAHEPLYRHTRIIVCGKHQLEQVHPGDQQELCWGTFEGISRSGDRLYETFADWCEFIDDRVGRCRSFFFRRSI